MNTKKYLVGAGLVITVLAGAASLVLANDMMDDMESRIKNSKETAVRAGTQMLLEVNHNGKALLRGSIKTVGTDSLTVTSWGGDWIVKISADTKLLPGTSMSQFKVDDFVGIQGIVSQSAAWTIDATLVRNWNARKVEQENRKAIKTERHNNQEEIKEVIKNESPKNWQGTASNINATDRSFTLTVDGTAYTVKVVTDAKIVNNAFLTAGFTDLKDGHMVRVWGPVEGTAVSAYVVKEISIVPSISFPRQ